MSAKGPDEDKTPKQHLIDALLNDIKAECAPGVAPGVEKISQEQCALEIVLHCKHKVSVGGDTVKVHDPSQVLDALLDVTNHSYNNKELKDQQRLKNIETAVSTLQKVIEFSGVGYQDLTKQGTELNHKFNHVMDDIGKIMEPKKVKMTQMAIEGICRQQIKKAEEAKNDAKSLIENEQGIDIAKFVSSKPMIGNHSKKRVQTVAKAIANDFQAFQMSETQLLGSDEHEIGKHKEFFNGINSMITDGILQARTENEAVNILRLYIEVGNQCVKNNDFDSGQAVAAAFSNANIERLFNGDSLTGLLDKISKTSKKDFLEITALFSPTIEGKAKLKVKTEAAANDWHTIPSPVFMVKLAGVDGMEDTFNNKLERASRSILPLIEQRAKQKKHPVDVQPQTNFVHLLATTARLNDDQQYEQMNKLRTDRKYDGKKFKSVEKVVGTQQPNFDNISNDYVPEIIEDPFIEDEQDTSFGLDEPADMQSYDNPVHSLEDIGSNDEIGPEVNQVQKIDEAAFQNIPPPLNLDEEAFQNIPPPLNLSAVKQAEEPNQKVPDAEGLKEQKQEFSAVEQPRNVRRLTIMFETKIEQKQEERRQERGNKKDPAKQENKSSKGSKFK